MLSHPPLAAEPRLLRNVTPPPGLHTGPGTGALDIRIEAGRIAEMAPAGTLAGDAPDLGRRMAWPCFADLHTHLDKGHIWPRAANPDGSFMAALETVDADRQANWSAADVTARMDFALRCAFAHGTAAIRTHLDSKAPQHRISWPAFAELRERWAGRIELQAVALATPESLRGAIGEEIADTVAAHGGIMGGVPFDMTTVRQDVERLFDLAEPRGLGLDLHVDETGDAASNALRHIAEVALERRFAGRITCGHCCSLAVQEEAEALRTLDLVAQAGIAIVSLPMCNMYLQDRVAGRTPRWRGVTLIREMLARGIAVAVASDNTRDPFYAYGDLDMHEVLRQAVRIAHLDHPLDATPALLTTSPAGIMGLDRSFRLEVGAPADLILLEGRSMSEILSRPEAGRIVLRAGRVIDATPPAYAELDDILAAPALCGASRADTSIA